MKRLFVFVALLISAPAMFGQLVAATPRGVVVAHDGRLALDGVWSAEGVENPTAIASDDGRVVVVDALHDVAVIADLATGRTTRLRTAATPIAVALAGDDVFILARDARLLQRAGGADIPVAADPAFLRTANGNAYVYSRAAGVIAEISGDRLTRTAKVEPFASDFEISGKTAYLVYPRDARVRTVNLESMTPGGELAVGAVPVDLAFAGGGSALTARILAVADPSAKRVWLTEGTQSILKAILRGFMRGFLGLGLFGRHSEFPAGVDRVAVAGRQRIAYDSSSGTLYRFGKRHSSVLAKGVKAGAFAVTADSVVYWQNGRLVTISE